MQYRPDDRGLTQSPDASADCSGSGRRRGPVDQRVRLARGHDARPAVPDGAGLRRARPRSSTASARSIPRRSPTAPPEEFAEICSRPPAVHRFPGAMAARLQALAQHVVDHVRRRRRRDCGTPPRPARSCSPRCRRCPGSASRSRRSSSPCSASSWTSARPAGRRSPARTPRRARSGRSPTSTTPPRWPRSAMFKQEQKKAKRAVSRVTAARRSLTSAGTCIGHRVRRGLGLLRRRSRSAARRPSRRRARRPRRRWRCPRAS